MIWRFCDGYCFNTQPPEGGCQQRRRPSSPCRVSTLSRPKAAVKPLMDEAIAEMFQHSAARRRLSLDNPAAVTGVVSTLSRPKAADVNSTHTNSQKKFQHSAARRRLCRLGLFEVLPSCFNTQPPEGGWTIAD